MNFANVYHLELSIFMPIEMFCFELVFMGNWLEKNWAS